MTKAEILTKEKEEKIPYDKLAHGICNWIEEDDQRIPVITGVLKLQDHLGTLAVRTGFMRKHYKVPSGLYALGKPDETSEVFVTANYKYSFDLLRQSLEGLDAWILVLDTQGINVWCAAGKGTFSSRELIYQIHKWKLKKRLKYRNLILPQLGATQMEPHLVRRYSGFRVQYGPVRASDLKLYLESNKEATETMRRVSFTLKDRLYLTPVEVHHSIKYVVILLLCMLGIQWISGSEINENTWRWEYIPLCLAFLTGTVLYPVLLPWLPFKRFSLKGFVLGGVGAIIYVFLALVLASEQSVMSFVGVGMGISIIVSVLGLAFTGSTTYTSYAGVDLETRQAIPFYALGSLMAAGMWIFSRFL